MYYYGFNLQYSVFIINHLYYLNHSSGDTKVNYYLNKHSTLFCYIVLRLLVRWSSYEIISLNPTKDYHWKQQACFAKRRSLRSRKDAVLRFLADTSCHELCFGITYDSVADMPYWTSIELPALSWDISSNSQIFTCKSYRINIILFQVMIGIPY